MQPSGWTFGNVTSTCTNSNVANSDITYFCQDRVATTSAGGDSGSPYFVRIGETNQIHLIGIHWGSGGGTTVMSAMNNIRYENEGPTGWITYPGQNPPPAAPR
jgi:secreted trypsin-like serine protease